MTLVAILLLAGCAGEQAGDAGSASAPPASSTPTTPGGGPSEPPMSSAIPPTAGPPSVPPRTPTDPRPPKDVLVGRVIRGGSGPCFGLETDEGKRYALYSTETVTLEVGETIKVQYAPLYLKINCGEGEHVSAVKITRVG